MDKIQAVAFAEILRQNAMANQTRSLCEEKLIQLQQFVEDVGNLTFNYNFDFPTVYSKAVFNFVNHFSRVICDSYLCWPWIHCIIK